MYAAEEMDPFIQIASSIVQRFLIKNTGTIFNSPIVTEGFFSLAYSYLCWIEQLLQPLHAIS